MKHPPKIGFISLGCAKALVDSERMMTQLRASGYLLVADYADADLVVVNTCGFIDAAVAESLESIAEALAENGRVVVTGCLGVREEEIRQRFPAVLAITGPNQYQAVLEAVQRHQPILEAPFETLLPAQGVKLTPPHYAYLKIAEGCNQSCSFCIIPQFRGALRSRPLGEILREAETLVAAGVRELLVVSQDTGAYGLDLRYRPDLWQNRLLESRILTLARELGQIAPWVRLHYLYPYPHIDQLLPLMAEGLILPYLDIPFQHADPRILRQMRRPASSEKVLQRIAQWRSICPDLTIRSTFIVGFPGETEQEFSNLLAFLQEAQLDRVGCFAYSPVAGASANDLPDQLQEEEKQERWERLMQLQQQISERRLAAKVGSRQLLLVDRCDEQGIAARSRGDAPEVDGVVWLDADWDLQPGDFVEARITDHDSHDLFAEPVDAR
jgi:ribosomal protein S12 methylthiotransferase